MTEPSGASFFDHTPTALAAWLAAKGQAPYRARQMFDWVYRRGATAYDEMTDLPRALRGEFDNLLPMYRSTVVGEVVSNDGTTKQLLRWPDGATSECVSIPADNRRTACISTQVGCGVGCVFCASGIGGLQRQLSGGEIVEQAMRVAAMGDGSSPLTNVVFMGLGEPLANYRATLHAIDAINGEWGMGIGARRITVSTVGLPGPMRRLADEKRQITLALSLHAPNDALRRRLIPWAENIGIDELLDAAAYYFDRTGREVTLEYVLLRGVNDASTHAHELARVAKRIRSNVNLITFNPVAGLPYHPPTAINVKRFLDTLRSKGVNAHARPSRGADIDAACGQLRRRAALDHASLFSDLTDTNTGLPGTPG